MLEASDAGPRCEKPAMLITIDTEGDNLWSAPRTVTTENARFLPRFQDLCESFGFKPTWLTTFEMADSPVFQEFGRDVLRRGAGEIGMHLHAWNSPPVVPLTGDDRAHLPYLIEYPAALLRDKVRYLTELLEDRFEQPIVSHRAGRWALSATYVRTLVEQGYRVDCSVTPHRDWSGVRGSPSGTGGTDYTGFPTTAYFMDLDRIDRPGNSPLLEVPVSIVEEHARLARLMAPLPSGIRRAVQWYFPAIAWLRPNGRNRRRMLRILELARQEGWAYVQFMLHSSELMPGGSPAFRTRGRIERLYEDLDILFMTAAESFAGRTLSEFRKTHRPRPANAEADSVRT